MKHREEERPGRFITFHHAFWGAQTMEAAVAGTGPIALIYGLGSRVRTLLEADLVEGGVVTKKPTTQQHKGTPTHNTQYNRQTTPLHSSSLGRSHTSGCRRGMQLQCSVV